MTSNPPGVGPTLVDLDGPANFRDLGGYPTVDGGSVRHGRIFRSDSLSYLTAADVAHLREAVGVRTVIDLRAPHEVEDFGHGPLELHVRQLHMPIVDQTRDPAPDPRRTESKFLTLEEIYRFMLVEYAHRFAAVVNVIADLGSHPVVFHCAAGKDRTGLTSAMILGICDVPDEMIVADFAVTETRMPTMIARHTGRVDETTDRAEVAVQNYGAQPATMTAVLAWIRDEYGSITGYLESAGVAPATLLGLRTAIVAPGAE